MMTPVLMSNEIWSETTLPVGGAVMTPVLMSNEIWDGLSSKLCLGQTGIAV